MSRARSIVLNAEPRAVATGSNIQLALSRLTGIEGLDRVAAARGSVVSDIVRGEMGLMKANSWRARTKRDLIIEVWESLDCESVGVRELKQIQRVIEDKFGAGSVDSPASIARTLADEGAVLRHPEVLNLDTEWRERELLELVSPHDLNFSGLTEAAASIKALDTLRRKFEENSEQGQLGRLREMTFKLKQDVLVVARSKIVERHKRLEAREIAHWLTVWLQSPDVFDDWLSLRQRSPEFIQLTK